MEHSLKLQSLDQDNFFADVFAAGHLGHCSVPAHLDHDSSFKHAFGRDRIDAEIISVQIVVGAKNAEIGFESTFHTEDVPAPRRKGSACSFDEQRWLSDFRVT